MKYIHFEKKDVSLIIIMILWVIVIVSVISYTLSTTAGTTERRLPVYSVDVQNKEIALTFNCAWDTNGLDELLELLEREEIYCTFFFVGEFAQRNPEAVRKIYNKGHETGNHSMYHTDPVNREFAEIVSDINVCNELLYSLTGTEPRLYRAPSGSYDNKTIEAAESLGMTAIQWDTDSIDWKDISSRKIVDRVASKVTEGSVVLFHLGKDNTLDALPEIIRLLKNKGYSFSKVGDMLLDGETYVDSQGRQRMASFSDEN